jgi:glycosyltransferase involved in cell wall biosynthesis
MHLTLVTSAFLRPEQTDFPGVGRYSTELVRALARRGIAIRVVVPTANDEATAFDGDVEVQRVRGLRSSIGPIASVGQAGLLSFTSRLAKTPQLVGDTDLVQSTIPLLSIDSLRDRWPVVAFGHHVERVRQARDLLTVPFGNSYSSYTFRRADAVVTPSEATAAQLIRRFDIDRSKVGVIHHGIDTERFYRDPTPQGVPTRPELRTILFVGPLNARKNVPLLIHAFMRLNQSHRDIQLVLVGRGPLETQVDRLARRPPLRGKLMRLEKVSDDLLRGLYSSADVFVSASLDEGFGFAAVEAMACRTPVVALDTPINREIIGDSGILLSEATAADLADAIQRVLQDTALANDLGEKGRARVEQAYSWSIAAERYERLYRRLIDSGSETPRRWRESAA